MAPTTSDPNKVIEDTVKFKEILKKLDVEEGREGIEPLATVILMEFIDQGLPEEVKVGRDVDLKLELKYDISRDVLVNAVAMRTGNYGYELVGRDAERYHRRFKMAGKGPHNGFVLNPPYLQ